MSHDNVEIEVKKLEKEPRGQSIPLKNIIKKYSQ